MPDDSVEGTELALTIGATVKQLEKNKRIESHAIPLTVAILAAVCENQPLEIPWDRFYRFPELDPQG